VKGLGSREKKLPIAEVETPGITTIEKVSELLKVGPEKLVKTLIYKADDKIVALLVRGDFDANGFSMPLITVMLAGLGLICVAGSAVGLRVASTRRSP